MLKIKKIVYDNIEIILCFFVLTVYLCLGFSLSIYNNPHINIYLGADNTRAFDDLMHISNVSHYRIKVHPLLLMLIQPITMPLDVIVHQRETTLVVVQSVVGMLCTDFVYRILRKYSNCLIKVILLTLIYAMSFSNMLFSSTPETFIFAAFFLLLFWRYVVDNLGVKNFTLKHYIMLSFFGIVSFGITLTNYFQFLIGLLFLIYFSEENRKKKIKTFLIISLGNALEVLGLAKIQQLAWKGDTPFFLESFYVLFGGERNTYEEFRYMDFGLSFQKLSLWIEQCFFRPFVSSKLEFGRDVTNNSRVLFGESYFLIEALLFIFLIVFICSFVLIIRNRKIHRMGIVFIVALMFNIALHFVYGYHEAFIYSSHYIFLIIFVVGIGTEYIPLKYCKILNCFLFLMLVAEIIVNLKEYRNMIGLVVNYLGNVPYAIVPIFIRVILVMLIFFAVVFWFFTKKGQVLKNAITTRFSKDNIILGQVGLYSLVVILFTVIVLVFK